MQVVDLILFQEDWYGHGLRESSFISKELTPWILFCDIKATIEKSFFPDANN